MTLARTSHRSRVARLGTACLAAIVSLLCLGAPQANAASLWDLFKPPPRPAAAPIPAVGAPIAADPATGPAVGTMIMAFGSAWAGHHAPRQQELMSRPGELLRQRGWRVVSIDYEEGPAGLQNVLDTVGSELARKTSAGPLCLYGESSGAQLALVAASRLPSIDCVIGVATPTDLALYEAEGRSALDKTVGQLAERIGKLFGTTTEALAPWNPVALAPAIRSDVTLIHESDDPLIAASYATRFQAARPTTQVVMLEPGADASVRFAHGTASDAGRARYAAAVGSFADREIEANNAERSAARTGCAQVKLTLAEAGRRGLQSALRCLALKDSRSLPGRVGAWRRSVVRMRGEVNPARLWAALRRSAGGRSALLATAKRRARISVLSGDPSRVTLRADR